ncbi:MAG: penicillin acylase family protein, partial [Acidobacteriota bacterium]
MKIIKRSFIGLIVIVLLLMAVLFIWLNGTKPFISGTVTAGPEEIKGKITIDRDKWGVPLIEAENGHDMFWAMGFVHASDRLFQMD